MKSNILVFALVALLPFSISFDPANWNCIPGVDTPVRVNSEDEVQCMSLDGVNCLGNCAVSIKSTASIKPLTCGGGDHQKKWGIIGYNDPDHWCSISKRYFSNYFYCVPGLSSPMRIFNGDAECLSYDGKNCQWDGVCKEGVYYDAVPLTCGVKHKAAGWGITGYDSSNHWCPKVMNFLTKWQCVDDISTPIRKVLGEVQCLSDDGINCKWEGNCASKLRYYENVKPVVCGTALLASVWKITGYENPNHWCAKGMNYLTDWKCIPGISTPIRKISGDIQCLSVNGVDCIWEGDCYSKLGYKREAKPVVCGAALLASVWKINGYSNPNHWCKKGLDNYAPWNCVSGVDTPIRYVNGNIQCLSFDGINCYWNGGRCLPKALYYPEAKPLTCGTNHLALFGITGYNNPSHWCTIGLNALRTRVGVQYAEDESQANSYNEDTQYDEYESQANSYNEDRQYAKYESQVANSQTEDFSKIVIGTAVGCCCVVVLSAIAIVAAILYTGKNKVAQNLTSGLL